MTAVLVVGLPADDGVDVGVPLGHLPGDSLGLLSVHIGVEAVVTTTAEVAGRSVGFDLEDLGVLVDQPLRRRRCRGAEYHVDPGLAEQRDGRIEPFAIELDLTD